MQTEDIITPRAQVKAYIRQKQEDRYLMRFSAKPQPLLLPPAPTLRACNCVIWVSFVGMWRCTIRIKDGLAARVREPASQQTGFSCQLPRGLPQMQRAAFPETMPALGQSTLGDRVRWEYKGLVFLACGTLIENTL